MKKKRVLLFSILCMMSFASCGGNPMMEEDTYTVIWQNDNGDILEMDRGVKEGSLPTYDGETPTKKSDGETTYVFSGWDSEIEEVYHNTTYTATYSSTVATFTVTWQNEDGTILEKDVDVAYGMMPSYDGETPQKENSGDSKYIFAGWSPSVSFVKEDVTYVATYTSVSQGEAPTEFAPVFSKDFTMVQYGMYPQTHVSDEALIARLNALEGATTNGWYFYEGKYYTKEKAKTYQPGYTFEDGETIVQDQDYWFVCAPITWKVLQQESGQYVLLSSMLLDVHDFYRDYENRTINSQTIYANNYEQSDLRAWLNGDFFSTAFAFHQTSIQEMSVNNAASTFGQKTSIYASNNTKDKVTLPSYQDYLNPNYGFDGDVSNSSLTRACQTTDYVRVRGAWCNTQEADLRYHGSYWTRSPSSEEYYAAYNVNSGGYLSTYAVDGATHCVRPCISIRVA